MVTVSTPGGIAISFIALPPSALFRFIYYITKLIRKQAKKKKNRKKNGPGASPAGLQKHSSLLPGGRCAIITDPGLIGFSPLMILLLPGKAKLEAGKTIFSCGISYICNTFEWHSVFVATPISIPAAVSD